MKVSSGTENVNKTKNSFHFLSSESEDSLESEGLQIHKSLPSIEIVKHTRAKTGPSTGSNMIFAALICDI